MLSHTSLLLLFIYFVVITIITITMIKKFFSFKFLIRQFTKNNYFEWLIDIRAHLRFKKLWKYIQTKVEKRLIVAQIFKWIEFFQNAADVMIFIINDDVKQKFNEIDFNCDFAMLFKITFLLQSIDDVEFMRFTKKYYTLKFESFSCMFDYFIYIKLLKERMRVIKMKLNDNKQILLCFVMSLFENIQYFIKIWVMTKNFTVEMTRNMFLKKNRRTKSDFSSYDFVAQQFKKWCTSCQKFYDFENCWKQHFEKTFDWIQQKWITQRKRKIEIENEEASKKKQLTKKKMIQIIMSYIKKNSTLCYEKNHE